MSDRINRIGKERRIVAMVALDTLDPIADRIDRLMSHGRRMAMAHRFATYTGEPPELHAGLTLDGEPQRWKSDGGAGLHVRLAGCRSALDGGFGFSVYADRGPAPQPGGGSVRPERHQRMRPPPHPRRAGARRDRIHRVDGPVRLSDYGPACVLRGPPNSGRAST